MRLKKLSRDCSDILYGAVNTNFAKGIFLHYCVKVWAPGKSCPVAAWGLAVPSFPRWHRVRGCTELMWLSHGLNMFGVCKVNGDPAWRAVHVGSLYSSSSEDSAASCTLHCAIWQLISPGSWLSTGSMAYVSAEGSLNECASAEHIQLVSFLGEICQKLLSSCSCSLHVG